MVRLPGPFQQPAEENGERQGNQPSRPWGFHFGNLRDHRGFAKIVRQLKCRVTELAGYLGDTILEN